MTIFKKELDIPAIVRNRTKSYNQKYHFQGQILKSPFKLSVY